MNLGTLLLPLLLATALTSRAAEPALALEWVTVGDPGNPPDPTTGRGSVAAPFQISKHEITVAQYAAFLNAVAKHDPNALWNGAQKIERKGAPGQFEYAPQPGGEHEPILHVSFLDAARFANWLHRVSSTENPPTPTSAPAPIPPNPKPSTESGAYDLSAGGGLAPRTPGARAWIPNEEEWYKAAYYQPQTSGGPPSHYWKYPTRSDTPPTLAEPGNPGPNLANFLADVTPQPNGNILRHYNNVMPVGSFPGALSPYGTLDQGGNAWEWIETTVFSTQRVIRGGHMCGSHEKMLSRVRTNASPNRRYPDTGFRLARPTPPPSEPPPSPGPKSNPTPQQPQ
jgi:sulfatase modifying factor 1